jgi:tetratricopeptide (TPR) repeat protein/cold shock CspA family protein
MGRYEEASNFGENAMSVYPDDKYIRTEMNWLLYDSKFKAAFEKKDLGQTVFLAKKLIGFPQDDFMTKIVSDKIVELSKERKQWDVLLEWAQKIQVSTLSPDKKTSSDGKSYMSEKEKWFINVSRAYLESEQYDKAVEYSNSGLSEFEESTHLQRTKALGLINLGQINEGKRLLNLLLKDDTRSWYVYSDLAEVEYKEANYSECLRLLSLAVDNRQSEKYKITSYLQLAVTAYKMSNFEFALLHAKLAQLIRQKEGWKESDELSNLISQIKERLESKKFDEISGISVQSKLSKLCESARNQVIEKYESRETGVVGQVIPGKDFTFIRIDGTNTDIFVKINEIPSSLRVPGSHVSFVKVPSFDRKKQQDSLKAIKLRQI